MRSPARTTTRTTSLALAGLTFALGLAAPAPARAAGDGSYSMEVLVDGIPLDEYAHRGKTYVEALRGREYSVRLTNNSRERIAVALSVDGLNSIDAKTTSSVDASKWILDPWQSITIDGWQTSSATARKFYFTAESSSYGAWLGKTKNLGIVAAAFFRERRPEPAPWWSLPGFRNERHSPSSPKLEQQEKDSGGVDAPAAESYPAPSAAPQKSAESKRKRSQDLSDDLAATGIGRELDHEVTRVEFRAERSPSSVVQVRYEYRDALLRLGVLHHPRPSRRDPLDRRERGSGFTDTGYAPDPYRR